MAAVMDMAAIAIVVMVVMVDMVVMMVMIAVVNTTEEVVLVVTTDMVNQLPVPKDLSETPDLINTGKLPFTDNKRYGNFFFKRLNDPAEISKTVVDMVARRLPAKYGFDPFSDIQVLSPMHKSETGVSNLNALIQENLNPFNPSLPEIRKGDWTFRRGDKVMQIRNNYDKMVFNGDIGRIVNIDLSNSLMRVRFDDLVEYSFNELDDIVPAYAISVHKSQGSEFRCVVMPVSTQHYIMLKRNLIYTAVTRARELVVLIGDIKALAIAVHNDQVSERFTSLKDRLVGI